MGSRFAAFLLACAVAAFAASSTAAMSAKKQSTAKKHPAPAKPKFDARYDCAKAAPVKLVNSFLSGWEGKVAIKDESHNVSRAGGGSGCGYKHADGPYAGQFAGNLIIEYGSRAAGAYRSDEHGAKTNGAAACAKNPNTSGDPRVCGPVEIAGVGNHAYEAFFYIASLKGKVFVQLQAGSGVANGEWIPSSTLPPQDVLENAEKAIVARLP
jgi:hypothetical protein